MADSTYTFFVLDCPRSPKDWISYQGGTDVRISGSPEADFAETNVASCQCGTSVGIKCDAMRIPRQRCDTDH